MPTNADRCTVCNHPKGAEIDALLEAGSVTRTAISQQYGVTRFSVIRHNDKHLGRPNAHQKQKLVVLRAAPPPPPPAPEPEPEPTPKAQTTEERKRAFIDTVADTGSQQKAMRAAGVNWFTVRAWHEQDEQFTFSFNLAVEHAKDALIDIARERAIHGTRQVTQIIRKKLLIEERVEYKPSDTALLALLKAYHPDKFGDKLAVTQTTVVKAIDAAAWEAI